MKIFCLTDIVNFAQFFDIVTENIRWKSANLLFEWTLDWKVSKKLKGSQLNVDFVSNSNDFWSKRLLFMN